MQLGQVIGGKYRLLRLLGDGGMGAVYEAHHEVLGARVAIKVLHPDLAVKPELVDRFLREARVLAQIANPHVVRVLDIAMAEGSAAYIVMELLSGEALSELLGREHKVPMATAVDYASQVLEALAAAHALGVVHRDLKPENVFVTREGDRTVLKLIDFGIAKAGALGSVGGANANLTLHGALMGTPEYMAPEQAHSADRVDARSDLYAVGVLLYEMLAGARPVEGTDPRVVAQKVERGEVHPLIHRVPDVPRELAGLVHRAMAARPELRFATAVEMRHALEAAMASKRTSGAPAALAAPTAPALGSGTMFDTPAAEVVAAALASPPERSSGAGGTDPGSPPLAASASFSSGSGAPPPPAPIVPLSAYVPSPAPAHVSSGADMRSTPSPVRGRPRGGGGVGWVLAGLLVVLGGGVALALNFGKAGSGTASSVPASTSSATTLTAVTPPSTPDPAAGPAPDPAADPAVGPLPSSPAALVPSTRPGPAPHGSGNPAPTSPTPPPSSTAVANNSPFGVPPFGLPNLLPSSIPNPFPNPATSGVGPVITIPTTFPGFGFPPPDPPSPAPSTTPRRKNH